MTVIVCAATECIHNDGGICCNDEVTFTFVGGSHVEMTCESFESRGPGDPKVWRGDTYAYDNRVEERSESVAPSHQRGRAEAHPGEPAEAHPGEPTDAQPEGAAHPGERARRPARGPGDRPRGEERP